MVRLEILALAIGNANGAFSDPSSKAFLLRNPGLLRSFSLVRPQAVDDDGVRIFSSFVGGLRALVNDLEMKCSGKTRAVVWKQGPKKLMMDSSLFDLLKTLHIQHTAGIGTCLNCGKETLIVDFLKDALKNDKIDSVPISWFLEAHDG